MPLDITGLVSMGMDIAQDLCGDVTVTATVQQAVNPTYNAATGTATLNKTSASVSVIIGNFDVKRAKNAEIKLGDKKAVIRVSDLEAVGITEIYQDTLFVIGGVTYGIIDKRLDPTNQVYILQIRSRAK